MGRFAQALSFQALSLMLAASACALFSVPGAFAKGVAPQSAGCDPYAKNSTSWNNCVTAAQAGQSDDELFYAGYWLAKTGRFDEALSFLNKTKVKDERVLTYIGYATRKSGDIQAALGFYDKALALNPDFTIARSYLGEAHVSLGNFDKARAQLREIENRCGTSCTEYTELDQAIKTANATRL